MTERLPQSFDAADRVDPPLRADEVTTLRAFLDYQRDTFRWKCAGLTHEQLAQRLPPSDMTLGGMMKHLAIVDSSWFEYDYAGREYMPPFDAVDWDADPDWEWRTAEDDSPEELRRLFDEAVRRADAVLDAALAEGAGLDSLSARESPRDGEGPFSLRRILVHMIEEYARHNGHADLIRQSIDGQTGD
ncbi:MAG: DinB family protein [Nocardioides sp.]|nr:DinB family protein [Nocardioides sp.]